MFIQRLTNEQTVFTTCLIRLEGFGDCFNLTGPIASVPNDNTQDPHVDGEKEQPGEEQPRHK
jgi:hypothetical protein